MTDRHLIVTADDAGLHPSIAEAVIRAHEEGIVTAASVVPNGEAFSESIVELKRRPSLQLGVHLTLVEERPLSPPDTVSSLLARNGLFHHDYRTFVARYATGRIRIDEVEREWRAQIRALLTAGVQPQHLNSHQHLHLLPALFRLSIRLAVEFGIPFVRTVNDRGGSGALSRRVQVSALSYLGRRGARLMPAAVQTSASTIGVTEAGHLDEGRVVALSSSVRGVTELIAHPGTDNVELSSRYAWRYDWERELEALVSRRVREELASRSVALEGPVRF